MKFSINKTIVAAFLTVRSFSGLCGQALSEIKFEHLTVDDGLSENAVTCIMQDRRGYIWIGTHDGLNKFDGYGFTIYRNIQDNRNSLSDNAIGALCEDKKGILWVGTFGGGLNRFNAFDETFTRYIHDKNDVQSLSNDNIGQLFADSRDRIWMKCGGGTDRIDSASGKFIHVTPKPGTLFEDRAGIVWLAVASGNLYFFDEVTQCFTNFPHSVPFKENRDGIIGWHYVNQANVLLAVKENAIFRYDLESRKWLDAGKPVLLPPAVKIITCALASDSGKIWISTLGNGLFEISSANAPVRHWIHSDGDPSSLSNNFIYHVFKDRSGIIWISTEGGGINLIKNSKLKFPLYQHEFGNKNSISSNYVTSIFKDAKGILWLGTGGMGLNRINEAENQYIIYKHDAKKPAVSLNHDYITSITPDIDPDYLWIGTSNGLNRLNKTTGACTIFKHDPASPRSLFRNDIGNTFRDSQGDLWVTANIYLDRLPAGKEEFTHYRHDPNMSGTISEGPGYPIYEDRYGVIWIGSWRSGLNRYNRADDDFSHFIHDDRDPQSLSHNRVWAICEDRSGRMWIGTWGGGLNLFDRTRNTFKHYYQSDGLASNVIYGILEDERGNLWMSTNNGISRFDPQTESFRNFDVDDGLQSREFNTRAFFKDAAGKMYFGGINGYNAFYPTNIATNSYIPSIVITSFKVSDREIRYDKPVQDMEEIVLAYDQNFLSLEFAALDYNCPKKNRYRYILEGLEKKWNYINAPQRFADYKDLDPGRYAFRVSGTNNDGVWNEKGLVVRISIEPPFWGTWWFRASALMIFSYLSYLFIGFIKRHFRLIHFWKSKNIIGNYKIIERIASGGMGIIYKGVSLTDKTKIVALKVLREEQAFSEAQRRRFINEGKIIDGLNHPHIVKIHERACQGQVLFIAMEYLEGMTLEDKINHQGILAIYEALDIMRQLTEAVAALHKLGIIHRDLKPGNIMLTLMDGAENFVKLLDFGVSRTEGMTRLTKSGMIIGTVAFVPPEQISSAEFGFPGDIYSLGVIFYEMTTGNLPFIGETTLDVMKQILAEDPIAPQAMNPGLRSELNAMILGMMNKDPRRRPTAEELLRFLRGLS